MPLAMKRKTLPGVIPEIPAITNAAVRSRVPETEPAKRTVRSDFMFMSTLRISSLRTATGKAASQVKLKGTLLRGCMWVVAAYDLNSRFIRGHCRLDYGPKSHTFRSNRASSDENRHRYGFVPQTASRLHALTLNSWVC